MGSFDSTNFEERGQDATAFPIWSKKGVSIVKKIPGGALNVIQTIGVDLPRLPLVVRVTAAELAALYGKVGVSGTLVFGWETASATLESIEAEEVSAGKDTYFATLNMIRLAFISSTPATARLTEAGDTRLTETGDVRITE